MNEYLLEYEMKRKGITVKKMCEELHMNPSTFYRKKRCTKGSDFSRGEIRRMCDLLALDDPRPIFFSDECR